MNTLRNILDTLESIEDSEPQVGDIVEMECGDTLIETTIAEVTEDGVVLHLDEGGMRILVDGAQRLLEGKTGPGLWANIHAKRERGERMRKKGEKGAPSEEALKSARAGSKNESMEQGVAEGSKQRLPIVMYKEISPDMMQGEDLYQVVLSQSPFWKVGETFSDDDMSMGSQQVRFISEPGTQQGVAEGSEDKVHLKTPKHGLADHPGRNTGVGLRTFSQTPEQDRCPKCNSLFKNHYKQGVAEGFSDVVKGVKRSLKGKEHPDVVASKHAGRAMGHYNQGDIAAGDKETKRYVKTRDMYLKAKGVAEGQLNEFAPGPFGGEGEGREFPRWLSLLDEWLKQKGFTNLKLVPGEGYKTQWQSTRDPREHIDVIFVPFEKKSGKSESGVIKIQVTLIKNNQVVKNSPVIKKISPTEQYMKLVKLILSFAIQSRLNPDEEGELDEAKYRGREVPLGKPMAGDVKKRKVFVKGPKGNVVKVNFGQKGVKIKKNNPARRKSFRARHNCKNPGPRWRAKYWSCRMW